MQALLLALALLQDPALPSYPGAGMDAHVRAGRYLAALAEAERLDAGNPDSPLIDAYGLIQSWLGLERESLETFDAMMGEPGTPRAALALEGVTALEAIPAIVEAAAERRIVVLNESHHMPRHRAFAAELARALREIGFDTFAAEAFFDVEGTRARGYPDHDTGYYTQDPVFGQLVREVLALGYRTVAYEWNPTAEAMSPGTSQGERIRLRESAQAQNLMERVFARDPEAKLFVYVGYSHATEDWRDRDGPAESAWMAARLAKLSGYDPFTIDQTVTSPRSAAAYEDPTWRSAVERGWLAAPKLLRRADGSFLVTGSYAGKVDAQVFHPPLASAQARPAWLAAGRQALALPESITAALTGDERLLVQAFRAEEREGAIPVDQFVVPAESELPSLLLPPGRYRVVVQDEAGERRGLAEDLVVD